MYTVIHKATCQAVPDRTRCGRRGRNKPTWGGGFTLIELMVALSVLVILTTLAIPSFWQYIHRNQVIAEANDLVANLHYSRAEATTRGAWVMYCRSANPNAAVPACLTAGQTAAGWLVYAIAPTEAAPRAFADGDTILKLGRFADNGVTISTPDETQLIGFSPLGLANGASSHGVCDGILQGADGDGRLVNVSVTGRVTMTETTSDAECTPT